jgi:hypothetical protein
VQDNQPNSFGGCCNDEIGDGHPMLAPLGQALLNVDCPVHHGWRDGSFVKTSALFSDEQVVRESSRAVEHFQIDDGACGDEAVFEQWAQTRSNQWQWESGQRALIRQVSSRQRQAPDITFGLLRSTPSILDRRCACRRRRSVTTASSRARLTASFIVEAPRTCFAFSRSSSSISTSLLLMTASISSRGPYGYTRRQVDRQEPQTFTPRQVRRRSGRAAARPGRPGRVWRGSACGSPRRPPRSPAAPGPRPWPATPSRASTHRPARAG